MGLFHHLLAIHVDGASGHTFLSSREIIIHELALFADGVLFELVLAFAKAISLRCSPFPPRAYIPSDRWGGHSVIPISFKQKRIPLTPSFGSQNRYTSGRGGRRYHLF